LTLWRSAFAPWRQPKRLRRPQSVCVLTLPLLSARVLTLPLLSE
jgi:hypothetical protein